MKLDTEAAATTAPFNATQALPWTRNQERIAWIVLYAAFFFCLALAVTIPLLARQFVLYSTEPQPGSLQAIGLTQEGRAPVRVSLPNVTLPIAVTDPTPLSEGALVETDQTSRAFLTLFEGSTAQIFPGSTLLLRDMRRPRFGWSDMANQITIEQRRGLVRYGAAQPTVHSGNPDGRPVHFVIETPHFQVWLSAGSYSLEVGDESSQVVVREGLATVRSRDGASQVAVGQGQRVQVAQDGKLAEPVPAAQNLIVEGNFPSDQLRPAWQPYADQGGDAGDINGSVGIVTVGDRRAVQILRQGSGQNSAITGIRQNIDKDVSDYRSLTLSTDVRVHYQSLSGGGYLASEYPLIIRIKYRDVNGSEAEYVRGFYYQNDANNPIRNGELIPRDAWVPFETSNLLEGLDPRPFRLLYIQIYASGWDYESYISGVRLTVE